MKEQTYKQLIESMVYDLMHYALELADIIDQRVNEHGMIAVPYNFASEIICHVQQSAKAAANELSWIASGSADLSEIYPEMKGSDE